jgi:cell wall-associated NlpC family hydrolase
MLRSILSTVGVVLIVVPASAQQPGVTLSPFVSFLPVGSPSPMAGLSLSFSGGPLAVRAGGHLAVQERTNSATSDLTTRPWGADADALAFLESYSYGNLIAFTPYVFVGASTAAVDSGAVRFRRQGWSYGAGASMPLLGSFGLFSEMRWRMSQYVLPNADNAPAASREFRVGMSFRVGGGGSLTDVIRVLSPAEGNSFDGASSTRSNSGAAMLLSTADEYVGTPYRRRGTSPSSGFDASGFVRFVFSKFGVNLPRASRDQARVGEEVRADWRALAPGDLVMFKDDGGINHVAIYVGKSRIIHSTETGGGVRYDDLNSDRGRWFVEHLAAARRVTPDIRGLLLDLARGFPNDISNSVDGPDHAPRAGSRKR